MASNPNNLILHANGFDVARVAKSESVGSRAMYLGNNAAQYWIEVSGAGAGSKTPGEIVLDQHRISTLKFLAFKSFVSLGVGDGCRDIRFAEQLTFDERGVTYIAVDISEELARSVVNRIGTRDALGFVADFEDQTKDVARQIGDLAKSPSVLVMFGGTISNFEVKASKFLADFLSSLLEEQAVLVEFPILHNDWTEESEPRLNPKNYANSLRRLIGNAFQVADIKSFVDRFDEFVNLSCEIEDGGHVRIEIRHKVVVSPRIITRRYNFDSLMGNPGFAALGPRVSYLVPARSDLVGVAGLLFRGQMQK